MSVVWGNNAAERKILARGDGVSGFYCYFCAIGESHDYVIVNTKIGNND